MGHGKRDAKQKTRLKKGNPIEIPAPKRGDLERLVKRVVSPGARGKGARRGPWRG